MQLRVPERDFATFLRQAQQLGTVQDFSQMGQDVTQSYNNYVQELATLHSEWTAYNRLFSRAQTMKDMLTIQQAIIEVQARIASLAGQQQGLLRAVALAQVTVNMTPPAFSNTAPPPVVTAWDQVISALGASGLGLLTFLAWAFPWTAIFAIVVGVYRWLHARRRKRAV
jgi:hypothetical protein